MIFDSFLRKIKLVIADIDGVLTDGSMYYSDSGAELKAFSIYDGGGVALLRLANIPLVILSGEKNKLIENRFKKLKVKDVRLGIEKKSEELDKILSDYGLTNEEVLFIGDFINDFNIMKRVGVAVCPKNACDEIKRISKIRLKTEGGHGALWEITVKLLKTKGIYYPCLKEYLKSK